MVEDSPVQTGPVAVNSDVGVLLTAIGTVTGGLAQPFSVTIKATLYTPAVAQFTCCGPCVVPHGVAMPPSKFHV